MQTKLTVVNKTGLETTPVSKKKPESKFSKESPSKKSVQKSHRKKKRTPTKRRRRRVSLSPEAVAARARNLNRAMPVIPALAEIIGKSVVTRCEAVKLIWDYVRAHDLKDRNDGRFIVCDKKLLNIFNNESVVHITTMPKLLSHCFITNLPSTGDISLDDYVSTKDWKGSHYSGSESEDDDLGPVEPATGSVDCASDSRQKTTPLSPEKVPRILTPKVKQTKTEVIKIKDEI
eukprot:Gregarina_sp_Poly_1__1132@NODE_1278_length_4511_cov_81_929118_g5_i1_p3_GENE_NODE_1278_length_4511_cov_81_929118_g5_i1NODE_1278_length_4511_cov_81_929118_g5_i1_p3_ORF_typecomplete_len232_score37_47SWIB/PF02201_18/8_2e20_NODE_1278_length_4511_cov_81_929118_g5_i136194314